MIKVETTIFFIALCASLVTCGTEPEQDVLVPPLVTSLGVARPLGDAAGTTYPRVIVRQDGSLLATVTRFAADGVTRHLQALSSHDEGATWHLLGNIFSGTGDIDNACPLELPASESDANPPRLLVAFRNHDRNATGHYTVFRLTVYRSDDGGVTWQSHSSIETDPPPWGVWEPLLQLAADKSVHVYYAKEYAADDQDIMLRRSSDGGLTWSKAQTVAGAGIVSRDGMPGVAVVQHDGKPLATCVFETSTGGLFHIEGVSSHDAGQSWQDRRVIFMPPDGHNAGAPQIMAVGQTLIASFMTDEDLLTTTWPSKAEVKIMQAGDPNGTQWINKQTVGPFTSLWAGLLADSPTHFWVTYDHDGAQLLPGNLLLQQH